MTRQFILFLLLALFVGLVSFLPINHPQAKFHTAGELEAFRRLGSPEFTLDTSLLFPHSNSCAGCHGFDVNGYASLTADGQDVNVHDDWSATLMANAAKDPFWRAKVSHEILVNPSHSAELQTKCTSCHAPQGHYTAILRGAAHYSMADLLADTIGLDGVSCGACHMQSTEQLGFLNSGNLRFDTNRVMYGPYEIPFSAPMIQYVGFEPLYSEHINDAGICAGCHTLITQTVDLQGNFTGQDFVEQATYHEWLNSSYDANNVTCQECHLPRLEEPIVISSNYLFLEGREPFGQHDMVGANTAMLKIMKQHREALDITANEEAFDETIAKTLAMLQEQSVDASLEFDESRNDTAFFQLTLLNKAGHKFPSGYPSRRAFIEFLVVKEPGDTVFHSGKPDANWEVAGLDQPYEPHFDYIDNPGQVQVYETVIADVTGAFTTVLERAATTLKDNRLPPLGFKTSHSAYDTTKIVGLALSDPNFNKDNGVEGTGADRITYGIPLNGYTGNLQIEMRLHYQSLPPGWMAPILAENTPEINFFRDLFDTADKSTVIVAEKILQDVFVMGGTGTSAKKIPRNWITVFPNPSSHEQLEVKVKEGLEIRQLRVFDSTGKEVWKGRGAESPIRLPHRGLYFLEIQTTQGLWTEKVVRD